jgi:RES domain-containing protein
VSQAAFRIYKSDHAETAMTGSGASEHGGRWN